MIIRVNLVATIVFAITAVTAAVAFTSVTQWIAAVVAMICFAIGIVAFIWSFWIAVQRSRGEQVAVVQLYLLGGGVAPPSVRRVMWLLLLAQIGVGLGTAFARANDTDGSPGTSLALGVLVPTLGFGLNGWWAALHGTYETRSDVTSPTSPDDSRDQVNLSGAPIDQNGEHG